MTQLNQIKSINWQKTIKVNRRKTLYVIFSFLGIYSGLGLFFDYILSPKPGNEFFFLFVFFILSLVILFGGFLWGSRVVLAGTNSFEITEQSSDPLYKKLYNVVEEMKLASSLRYMPKVYVLQVDYMNAFASGWSEKNAAIAISRPLLEALTRDELQAVVAHELTHIRNQDTRLLLAVSVVANFSIFLIDTLFRSFIYNRGGRRRNNKNSSFVLFGILAVRLLLPILTSVLLFYLSRKREFIADVGGVELTRDNQSLAEALVKIHKEHKAQKEKFSNSYKETPHESMRRLSYFYDPCSCDIRNRLNLSELFSTHHSLEGRLKALGFSEKI